MAKVDLGEKQICPECEKKFYDLNKRPAVCPYCQHSFDPASLVGAIKAQDPIVDDEDLENDAEENEDELDEDEVAAKELELDGDAASFVGVGDDEDDASLGSPNVDGLGDDDSDDDDDADLLVAEDVVPPIADDVDDDIDDNQEDDSNLE